MADRPHSYDYDALLACGRGELFGPGNAQLPLPPMLMFHRITEISSDGGKYGKGYIEAEFDIDPTLWFFQCHFVGDPVMPGCLGLDALWQLGVARTEHLTAPAREQLLEGIARLGSGRLEGGLGGGHLSTDFI